MANIQIFNNPEFGEIRTVIIDGEPWFVGNDIGKALGMLTLIQVFVRMLTQMIKGAAPWTPPLEHRIQQLLMRVAYIP